MSIAIRVNNLSKCYQLYNQPADRLKQFLWRGKRQFFREFWALHDVSFEVGKGEVLGIIGRNGAGKSTLLQLLCGTLTPTSGNVEVNGRIAALLELGAGFNPEFTGRENVFMSAAILGLSPNEIEERYEDIVDFSGIRDFIDQPVKTYSSGMYVRLAFSVATSVDPDILIVDEALSVGDGEFARKSFDRIRAMKEAGKTILFCSHSLYQVEAFCDRVLWLEQGELKEIGMPSMAIVAYNSFMDNAITDQITIPNNDITECNAPRHHHSGTANILNIKVSVDGVEGRYLQVISGKSVVTVRMEFYSDIALPVPSVAIVFNDASNKPITSIGTYNDGLVLNRDAYGKSYAELVIEQFPLLKGSYGVYGFLMCEQAIHVYEGSDNIAQLNVSQLGLEIGVVSIPSRWELA
ncbi:MAG: ABC transporter ATP-binding protein [Methylococcales bacterium]|nr:MAG: ABC transporter ATP-binding protein [Methylococcales bacterium]